MMSALVRDFRLALRSLLRAPRFFLTTAGMLALGLGVSVAMFSVLYGVALKSLPYPDADAVVNLRLQPVDRSQRATSSMTPQIALDVVRGVDGFAAASAYTPNGATYLGGDKPRPMDGPNVDANFFKVLGVAPHLGRTFDANDAASGERPIVLSWRLFQELGAGADVIGRVLRFDGYSARVIGVMPDDVRYPVESVMFWQPLDESALRASPWQFENASYVRAVARLAPGVSFDAVESQLTARMRSIGADDEREYRLFGERLLDSWVGSTADVLKALFVLSLIVLLIAAGNAAHLVLARGLKRLSELAVHQAIGAAPGVVRRRLMIETLIVGLAGTAAGLALAALVVRVALRFTDIGLPRGAEIAVEWPVVAFAAGIGLVAVLLVGIVPALRLSRASLNALLRTARNKDSGRGIAAQILPVASVALSLVAVVAALQLGRNLMALQHTDTGFSVERMLGVQLVRSADTAHAFGQQWLERLRALPGVEAAATTSIIPLQGRARYMNQVTVDGAAEPSPLPYVVQAVSPGYFSTMSVPLARGREFQDSDVAGSVAAAVISANAAKALFGDADPLGKRFRMHRFDGSPDPAEFTVVGVANDVRARALGEAGEPTVYVTYAQFPLEPVGAVVKTRIDPSSLLREAETTVYALDPNQGVIAASVLSEGLDAQLAAPRFFARSTGLFALLAFVLAVAGVAALLIFQIAGRRREFALRAALGATPAVLRATIVGQAARTGAIGLGIGLAIAAVVARLLSSVLVEGAGSLFSNAAIAAALMAVVLFLVALWQGNAAARVELNRTLREE